MKKAWITDLDGTLLNEQKTIDDRDKQGLELLKENNFDLMICTGRSVSLATKFQQLVDCDITIACNGGVIYDNINDKLLYGYPHTSESIDHLIEFAKKHELELNFYATHNIYHFQAGKRIEELNRYNQRQNDSNRIELLAIKDSSEITEPVYKAIYYMRDETEERKQYILDEVTKYNLYNACYSTDIILDINPKGIDKGLAVKTLKEKFDYQLTVAIGDGDNDIEMLEQSDISVAMGNGTNQVKDTADWVTEENINSGYSNAITRVINQEYK